MDDDVTISGWDAAVERLAGKTAVGSDLTSEQWARVPLAVRERAIFSARVEQAQTVQRIQDLLKDSLSLAKTDGVTTDRSLIRAKLRQALGAVGDSGKLTDLASQRRLDLIIDFQTQDAYGYGKWKQDAEDPDLLAAFPAQELIRVEDRENPRDWEQRWQAAGAAVGWQGASQHAMAALKSSPIWAKLSRFDRPWPPFDFGSGMGLRDLDADEAADLGVPIPPGGVDAEREGAAMREDFNKDLSASVRGLDEARIAELKEALNQDGFELKEQGGSIWLDGDAEMRRQAQPQGARKLEDLSINERRALTEYTRRPNGPDLNTAMRAGTASPKERAVAQGVRAGLQRLPSVGQRDVYRWISRFPGVDAWTAGAVIEDQGFTSASVEDRRNYGGEDESVRIRMVIRQLTAKDISPLSIKPEDREVLFARWPARLRITDRRTVGGVDTIFAEELP